VREPQLSLLIRELAIASESARKLSVALSLAWAYLHEAQSSANARSTNRGDPDEKKSKMAANGPRNISELQKELFE